jgi:DNA (cytosine-5)-methyltransferase 1
MLRPHELAGAMGLENHRFTGTLEDQVRQIGNAVPKNLAAALCEAALG